MNELEVGELSFVKKNKNRTKLKPERVNDGFHRTGDLIIRSEMS